MPTYCVRCGTQAPAEESRFCPSCTEIMQQPDPKRDGPPPSWGEWLLCGVNLLLGAFALYGWWSGGGKR